VGRVHQVLAAVLDTGDDRRPPERHAGEPEKGGICQAAQDGALLTLAPFPTAADLQLRNLDGLIEPAQLDDPRVLGPRFLVHQIDGAVLVADAGQRTGNTRDGLEVAAVRLEDLNPGVAAVANEDIAVLVAGNTAGPVEMGVIISLLGHLTDEYLRLCGHP